MNVLISPNAFKGTMSATVAGEIIQNSLAKIFPTFKSILAPIADGGDGTCQLLSKSLQLETVNVWTLDAIGRPILGFFGWDEKCKIAYIDISTASGISTLLKELIQPNVTSSYGTGLLIKQAIEKGAKEVILGLGGSATVDLGLGIIAALHFDFLDKNGREIPIYSPDFLASISHIQRRPNQPKIKFTCLCDVKNKLLGAKGAIPVFGPQKGIPSSAIESWENIFKEVIEKIYSKARKEFIDQEGFGAAGGVAAGLSAFFETTIEFGAEYYFVKIGIEEKVTWSDWIITGEGRYDSQSVDGKATYELLQLAHRQGKKIILITSGSEMEANEFDYVLHLADLNFTESNVKELAEKNLHELLNRELTPIFT